MYYRIHQFLLVVGWLVMMLGITFDIGKQVLWVKVTWGVVGLVTTILGCAMVIFRPQYEAWLNKRKA